MNPKGIVRKIDELGRIVIPKEIRKMMQISSGDDFEIIINDESIILKKYSQMKSLTSLDFLVDATEKNIIGNIYVTDKDNIISKGNKQNNKLDCFFKDVLNNRSIYESTNKKFINNFSDKENYYLILPIIINSDAVGLLINESDIKISDEDKKILMFLKVIIENKMSL